MNDELNEKIEELNEKIKEFKKETEKYSNELDKLYNSNPQKMIKTFEEINNEKKGLEQKIIVLEKEKKEIEIAKTSINSELTHAVNIKKKTLKN